MIISNNRIIIISSSLASNISKTIIREEATKARTTTQIITIIREAEGTKTKVEEVVILREMLINTKERCNILSKGRATMTAHNTKMAQATPRTI